MDEVELNDGAPGDTFSFPLSTRVFHSKVCIGGDKGILQERRARNTPLRVINLWGVKTRDASSMLHQQNLWMVKAD